MLTNSDKPIPPIDDDLEKVRQALINEDWDHDYVVECLASLDRITSRLKQDEANRLPVEEMPEKSFVKIYYAPDRKDDKWSCEIGASLAWRGSSPRSAMLNAISKIKTTEGEK